MSGGSMNYFYSQMEEYCECLEDRELIDLARDMAELFHDKEWRDSGDYGDGAWNKSVIDFKNKWFEQPRQERIIQYIDEVIGELKFQFGIGSMCKDCMCFEETNGSDYGHCCHCKGYMVHKYDKACERFVKDDMKY